MKKEIEKSGKVDVVLTYIAKFCTLISGLCLITLIVTFGWLVFGRYILNSTPTWVEQLALLLIVLITFLSSAVGVKEKTHLSVDIITYAAPKPLRSVFSILTSLCVGGFGLFMALEAYELTQFNWTTEIPLLNVPEGLRSLPMVISGALLFVFSLKALIEEFIHHEDDVLADFTEDPHQDENGVISEEKY